MTERDATVERELDAIDEALAAGVATAPGEGEREVQELALALAAQSPAPDPTFAAQLRERAEAGFPRERSRVARLGRRLGSDGATPKGRRTPRLRRPALAVAASIALALAVAVPLLRGDGAQDSSSGAAGTSAVDEQAGGSAGAAPEAIGPAPDSLKSRPRSDFAPARDDRRIERSASLTLAAPDSELERVADEIVAVTDRLGGFVLSSSVSTGAQGTATGAFELRLPADDLQRGLRELSDLGDVRARTQAGEDVTRGFVSVTDRLTAARAERDGLLRRLEAADTDVEAESIRARLDERAAEIDGLRSRLRDLRLRTDYATIDLALESDDSAGGASSAASRDGLGGALDDALGSLSASLQLLVRGLGIGIPVLLAAGALALGARTTQRRRRERALA